MARQAAFLIRLSNHTHWQEHKRPLLYLLGPTLLVVFSFVFTGPDQLIILKAVTSVLLALFWAIALVYTIFFFIKRYRTHQALRSVFEKALQQTTKDYLAFNEDSITISSADFSSELHWNYYTNYMEDSSTVYLFKAGTPYIVACYSAVEIGTESLSTLKDIVRRKLKTLREPLRLV